MSRTKGKARRGASRTANEEKKATAAAKAAESDNGSKTSEAGPSNPPSADSLIEKAHVLLAQSNFDLAIKFLNRALEIEPDNLDAKEVLGIAELEGGDEVLGRQHLLQLFPPHTSEPPSSPSPYLYLAQSAEDPREALGYYSTAAAMIEKTLSRSGTNGASQPDSEEVEAARAMAVTALVAMVEIWMSDLCFEDEAEQNCDALISRALMISPEDFEARLSLASIRMSQQKTEEAKQVALKLYEELEEKDAFDPSMPPLPTRLTLVRLLLEHSLHLPALSIVVTAREEDSLEVESAYLEGWTLHLRAEAIEADPTLLKPPPATEEDEETSEMMTVETCLSESMRALIECAQLFAEQDYPDEGIGAHVKELLEALEKRGVKPAEVEEEEEGEGGEAKDGQEGDWEDVEVMEDVEME